MKAYCRGCGGDGVGQHISPRDNQLIELYLSPIRLKRKRDAFVRLVSQAAIDTWARDDAEASDFPATKERAGHSQVFCGPLAHVIAHVKQRMADGFLPCDEDRWFVEMLLEADWCCRWCHGTGVPQLSVAALEGRVDARA